MKRDSSACELLCLWEKEAPLNCISVAQPLMTPVATGALARRGS